MRAVNLTLVVWSLLLSAAIFGFFYAWICSTMWGLDAADPRVAIAAMQAMNASVRNAVFAPAFFGTPVVLAVTAVVVLTQKQRAAALAFAVAAVIYVGCCLLVTLNVNVPMNEALGQLAVPASREEAEAIWNNYSAPWQFWNQLRTLAAGASFLAAVFGGYLWLQNSRPERG